MKRILYYRHGRKLPGLFEGLEKSGRVKVTPTEFGRLLQCEGREAEYVAASDRTGARYFLDHHYVHLLILDLRARETRDEIEGCIADGLALIDDLDHPEDVEVRYGFHRILALVSGYDPRVDQLLLDLGSIGIGHVIRQEPEFDPHDVNFGIEVMKTACDMVERREVGQVALAASGGGITGIYFELGALKCLDDVLSRGVNAFDMYFGISAGAVVSSIVAMGYSVDEFMASIAGVGGGRMPPIDLRLFRLGHLNVGDMGHRLKAAAGSGLQAARDAVRRRPATINTLLLDYTALVGPPLRSDMFERVLRELFESPGATNDFRQLPRPLFVGASDQDARLPVLFGGEGYDDIPISKAVQASLSLHPAFSAVYIKGRWYEDGAVTRTSDFVEAIARGADLIFVLDPFVPYISQQPGSANRRGILYNIDQDIRSLSHTRFQNTKNWVLRRHPQVSSYTFVPSNRLRRILSINPMDHRPYLEIWRGAYISTYQRIKELAHRLRGDLIPHRITIELDRAGEIAQRLIETSEPVFSDFFFQRRVELRQPPLATDQGQQASTVPSSWQV